MYFRGRDYRLAAAILVCAGARALAQHEGHGMSPGAPGSWSFSFHGSAFVHYVDERSHRGDRQLGLTDREMWAAKRTLAGGGLTLRTMTSVAAALFGGSGYPELLQTGGLYRHGYVHDRQHPDDAVMELSAGYERRRSSIGFSLYAAPIGEPALGPEAYIHRRSADHDPAAPLGHHWQDATHVSYGVVSAGVIAKSLRLEGSAFNARESDYKEPWPDFTGARLDSYAGRITWAAPRLAISSWYGYISTHDPLSPLTPMHRYGSSISTNLRGIGGGHWATTAIWGMNVHHHGGSSHALLHGDPNASPHHRASSALLETDLDVSPSTAIFGRAERVMKNGEELGFLGGDLTERYDVRSISAGFNRAVAASRKFQISAGARAAVTWVPEALHLAYGTRTPSGFTVFARVRSTESARH